MIDLQFHIKVLFIAIRLMILLALNHYGVL